jgi:hypothetical protein
VCFLEVSAGVERDFAVQKLCDNDAEGFSVLVRQFTLQIRELYTHVRALCHFGLWGTHVCEYITFCDLKILPYFHNKSAKRAKIVLNSSIYFYALELS